MFDHRAFGVSADAPRHHGEEWATPPEAGSREPQTPWSRGVLLGVVFGGLTSLASIVAIGQTWAACDIGVNAGANSLTLLFLGPVIWVAAAIPWVVLYGTLGRRHRGVALTAGIVFTIWFTWFLITWLGIPDSYPHPRC